MGSGTQPRIRSGPGGGRWTKGGGGGATGAASGGGGGLAVGGQAQIIGGIDSTTNKRLDGPVKGKVVRLTDKQVMINAGTTKRPHWVHGNREQASVVQRAKPKKGVGPGRKGYLERLDKREMGAVSSYKGEGYRSINGNLRAGKPPGETAKLLDSAVAKGSLGGDTKLYRSFHMDKTPGVGEVLTDKGFVSTSTRRTVAERFTNRGSGGGGKRALVRINAPAGTPAGFLPGQNEDEVLLGRNSSFAVKKIGAEGGITVVDVDVVSNEL